MSLITSIGKRKTTGKEGRKEEKNIIDGKEEGTFPIIKWLTNCGKTLVMTRHVAFIIKPC